MAARKKTSRVSTGNAAKPPASDQPRPPLPAFTRRPTWAVWLAFVGIGALVLRLIYLAELQDTPLLSVLMGDARQYDLWAQQIAAGHWVGSDVFYQAPLYPYAMAVIFKLAGHHLVAVRLAQAALGAASCVLLGITGHRLFGRRAGLVAALLLAVYPPAVFFDGVIQKASLDLFLMTVLLVVLGEFRVRLQWTWLIAAGVAMAAFTLSRENVRVLYPIVVLWLLLYFRETPIRRRVAWAAVFTASIVALLLPVGVRNYVIGGEFLMSTSQMGPNLYIGNHEGALGSYEPLVPDHGDAAYERDDATHLAEQAMGRTLSPGAVSDYWLNRSIDYIRSHPWDWLQLMGRKLLLTFNASEVVDTESIEVYAEYSRILRMLLWFNFGVVLPLAVLGAWQAREQWRRLALLYAMVAGLALSVAIFFVLARYRHPLVPIVLLFAAAALVAIPRAAREWRAWIPGVAMAVAVAVGSNLTLEACFDQTHLNLGSLLVKTGRPGEAIGPLQKAMADAPGDGPPHYFLGLALTQTGEKEKAIAEFSEAIRLRPAYADAHNALAIALQESGRSAEALQHFGEAVRLEPNAAEAHKNYGMALSATGQRQQAIVEYRESLRLRSDDPAVHNNLASALQQEGRTLEAIAHYEAALKLAPGSAQTHSNLALALKNAGNVAAAVEHFGEALRLEPDNPGIHLNFANLLQGLGRTGEAAEQFEQAAKLAPNSIEAQYALAHAYAQLGRWDEAAGTLERALPIAQAAGQSDAARDIADALQACRRQLARRTR
jgi:tetratricopeptide (TPR) repeat protein